MVRMTNISFEMLKIAERLKFENPKFSDIIDRMTIIAQEIVDSKDPFELMNVILPKLDAMDAFALGMIHAEMMRDGIWRL